VTTIREVHETCMICGVEADFTALGSSNTLAPPDLDTRPAEMMRSTMHLWVRRCASCGYCAPSIAAGPEDAERTVRSEAYARQAEDDSVTELGRRFLCWSMVLEAAGEFAGAGWASIHAAWTCDDDGRPAPAETCRLRAADLFVWARSAGQRFAEQAGGEEALLADLLRRCGQFERAEDACDAGLRGEPEPLLRKILEYQRRLIGAKDRERHTVDEA
jgi:hypothetical protein